MRVNWLSPLPPAETGVAEYARTVLPALAQRAEVTAWAEPGWDPELEELLEIRAIPEAAGELWRHLNSADMTIYHVGNNAQAHSTIWRLSRFHPGVVVLHDLSLQHLFSVHYLVWRREIEPYAEAMGRHHGPEGRAAARDLAAWRCTPDDLAEAFPLTLHGLEGALGVLTHGREGLRLLAEEGLFPVRLASLPFQPPLEPPRLRPREVGQPLRLIMMGSLGFNRRLEQVLEALAGIDGRDRFRLDIYGRIGDEPGFRADRARLGLEEVVRFHGRVDEDSLERALERSHLAINLRWPTMGEASLSQLRYFGAGIPALVTTVGWYAELPAEVVCSVRPDRERADIRGHLERLFADDSLRRRLGRAGYRFVQEEHRVGLYVDRLLALCGRAARFQPLRATLQMAEGLLAALPPGLGVAGRRARSEILDSLASLQPDRVE